MCLAGTVLEASKRMMKRQPWSQCSRENKNRQHILVSATKDTSKGLRQRKNLG